MSPSCAFSPAAAASSAGVRTRAFGDAEVAERAAHYLAELRAESSSGRSGAARPGARSGSGRRGVRSSRLSSTARSGGGRSSVLPLVVILTSLGFGGLVVRDHLLPALEPAPVEAQPAATAGREPEQLVPAPPTPASARRQLPLLSGDAAKRAIEQQRRQTALQKLQQPWTGEGMPPAL